MHNEGNHSSDTTYYNYYSDGDGLEYTIFDGIFYDDGKPRKGDPAKNDLISIGYKIPKEMEETMFVEQP